MFPLPLAYLMTTPAMMEQYIDKADAFDGLFNMVLGYGINFITLYYRSSSCYVVFIERDNDTFKNIKTIPLSSTQVVTAKIIVLFIIGVVFCIASTVATVLVGMFTLDVYGLGYKIFLAVETGIFITAGTLPLIVIVVFLVVLMFSLFYYVFL